MSNISYKSISLVFDSWELARQRFACEEEIGARILLDLFQAEPATKLVFGFQEDQDLGSIDDTHRSKKVLASGAVMVQMISGMLTLIGPDMDDMMEDVFADLGQRHIRLGVKPAYFELHGIALRKALKDILGPSQQYTKEVDEAWQKVFGALSDGIVQAMGAIATTRR